MLFPEDRAAFLGSVLRSAPSILSITIALLVAALTWSHASPVTTMLIIGLVFEVIGSYGIAAAQFLDASRWAMEPPWGGLSWVAIWMLSFTVCPEPAALGAHRGSGIGHVGAGHRRLCDGDGSRADPAVAVAVLLQLVIPYLLVVLIAHVSARIIYRLGTEIKRARELGQLRAGRAAGPGRHGRGVARAASAARAARGHQADAARSRSAARSPERQSELHARFEREAQATAVAALAAHHRALRLRRRRRRRVLLRDGAARRLRLSMRWSSGSARSRPSAPFIC